MSVGHREGICTQQPTIMLENRLQLLTKFAQEEYRNFACRSAMKIGWERDGAVVGDGGEECPRPPDTELSLHTGAMSAQNHATCS